MAKKKQTMEEMLAEALVPEEEQPYEVPGNWVWVRFGSVAKLYNGYAFKSSDYRDEGIPIIRISDIFDGKTTTLKATRVPKELFNEKFLIRKGDLLIAMSGATTGKTGIFETDDVALQNQRVGNIKEISDKSLYQIYKNYFVFNKSDEILSKAHGGAQPNISSKLIEGLYFPLPPLNEQKRIADKVERLLNKIDEVKQLIEEAKESFELRRAAILDKAFRGELTREWRENQTIDNFSKETSLLKEIENDKSEMYQSLLAEADKNGGKKPAKPRKFDNTISIKELPPIPSIWTYCTLGQVIYDFKYGTSEKSDTSYEGTSVIRIPNIGDKYIDKSNLKFLNKHSFDVNSKVKQGDILIVRSNGSKELVGKCAIVTVEEEDYAFASYLIRLRPIKVEPKYVFWLLKSDSVRKQLFSKSKSSAGINNINTEELATTVIPLPSLSEQRQVVSIIEELLKYENNSLSTLGNIDIDGIKQSILSKAFKGELGTNNPTEESAIGLLKEVLQEKQ